MSTKTQRGRFQSDLLKANTEIGQLTERIQALAKQQSQLVLFLSAVLIKNGGYVDITADELRGAQGFNVNGRAIDQFGLTRLTAMLPGSQNIVIPEAQAEEEPNMVLAPLTCGDNWHRDPEAVGLLCPLCGDRRKVAPELVAAVA